MLKMTRKETQVSLVRNLFIGIQCFTADRENHIKVTFCLWVDYHPDKNQQVPGGRWKIIIKLIIIIVIKLSILIIIKLSSKPTTQHPPKEDSRRRRSDGRSECLPSLAADQGDVLSGNLGVMILMMVVVVMMINL